MVDEIAEAGEPKAAPSLLLAGVPIEQVSILLGHSNIKVTQQNYNPWVRDRQLQLEADLQRRTAQFESA